jgi:hypothetical protein
VGHAPGLLKTILSQGSPQGGQTYVAATTVFHGWSAAIAIVEPVLRQPAAIVAPAPALMNVLRVTSSCFDFSLVLITLAQCLKSLRDLHCGDLILFMKKYK